MCEEDPVCIIHAIVITYLIVRAQSEARDDVIFFLGNTHQVISFAHWRRFNYYYYPYIYIGRRFRIAQRSSALWQGSNPANFNLFSKRAMILSCSYKSRDSRSQYRHNLAMNSPIKCKWLQFKRRIGATLASSIWKIRQNWNWTHRCSHNTATRQVHEAQSDQHYRARFYLIVSRKHKGPLFSFN